MVILALLACGPVVEMGDTLDDRQFRVKETLGVECTGPEGDARLLVAAMSVSDGDCEVATTGDTGWGGGSTYVGGPVEPTCEGLRMAAQASDCTAQTVATTQRYTLGILFTGWDPVWPMESTALGGALSVCSSDPEHQPPSNNFTGGTAAFTNMEESREIWVGYPAAHGNLRLSLCD